MSLLLLDEATEGGVPLWYLPKRLWLSVGKYGGVEHCSLVESHRRVWFEVEEKRFGVWLAKLEAAVHAPRGILIPSPTAPSWEWASYWVELGKTLPAPPRDLAWPVYLDPLNHMRDASDVPQASEAREIAPGDRGKHILALAAAVNLACVGSLLRSKDGLHPRDYTRLMAKEQRAAEGAKRQNPHDARIEALSLLMAKAEGQAKGGDISPPAASPPPALPPPPPPPPPPAGFGELETAKGARGRGAQIRMFNPAGLGSPSLEDLRWHPVTVEGKSNPALMAAAKDAAGVYAIRRKDSGGVVYVGESRTGQLWKTLSRHFWLPPANGSSWATDRPEDYEVAFHVTSRGKRSREDGDQRAMAAQVRWIEAFKAEGHRLANRDGGTAALKEDEPYAPLPEEDFSAYLEREGIGNPSKPYAVLGRLTFLRTNRAAYRWSLRAAPLLAYSPASGKLQIVYAGRILRPMESEERREYKRTHWGQPPPEGVVRSGGVAPAPFGASERVEVIAYTTRKGADRALVDYVHEFGEGAPRGAVVIKPLFAAHRCKGGCRGTCDARGSYALVGGTYRVDTRGIVG